MKNQNTGNENQKWNLLIEQLIDLKAGKFESPIEKLAGSISVLLNEAGIQNSHVNYDDIKSSKGTLIIDLFTCSKNSEHFCVFLISEQNNHDQWLILTDEKYRPTKACTDIFHFVTLIVGH